MARKIESGWLAGHMIRKARKPHPCDETHCQHTIQPGEDYAEGDPQYDIAGGFGHERFCIPCAGPDAARAAQSS